MAQPTTLIALHSSRLIRLLSELAVTEVEPSPRNFGGRFGQLFALSDSVSLSEMHVGLSNTHFEARETDCEAVTDEFLQSQKKVVESISARFVSEEQEQKRRQRFPALRPGATEEQLTSFDAYRGFYHTLQREMDREIQYMQSLVRDAAEGISPELAQLVVIDTTLGDTLYAHSRKLLAQVPRLLGLRFEYLRQHHLQGLFDTQSQDPASWIQPGGWLDQFRLDMHQTALAELELRLQPALGLLEAIHDTQPYQSSAPTQRQQQL